MPPLVSILIPCRNAAPWLHKTLSSCARQSHKNCEIILVDNGSSDASLEIGKQFQNAKLLVTQSSKPGASAARNEALRHAQGEFIQYVDADDLLSPDKIELQLRLLQQNPSGTLALCPVTYFFDGGSVEEGTTQKGRPFVDAEDPVNWLIELLGPHHGSMVPLGAWLVPRDIIDKAGPWNEDLSLNDDGEYFARVVLHCKAIRVSEAGSYCYRKFKYHQSLSRQFTKPAHTSALMALDLIRAHLLARTNNPLAKQALARHYSDIAFNAYPVAFEVSRQAFARASELGGSSYRPSFGSWKGEMLRSFIGWRAARLLTHRFQKLKH